MLARNERRIAPHGPSTAAVLKGNKHLMTSDQVYAISGKFVNCKL